MTLTEHIPGSAICGPVVERIVATFSTRNDLEDISFIKRRIEEDDFHRLSIDRSDKSLHLMAEYEAGMRWWVVGYLSEDIPELPTWKLPHPPKP